MGLIYDQAFALLALAHGHGMTGAFEAAADALRRAIAPFAQPIAGYAEAPGLAEPLFANPNMHFFESFMAWRDVSPIRLGRARRAAGVAGPGSAHPWARPGVRAVRRRLAAAPLQPLVWPGHLYEWAFLLLRHDPEASNTGARRYG